MTTIHNPNRKKPEYFFPYVDFGPDVYFILDPLPFVEPNQQIKIL